MADGGAAGGGPAAKAAGGSFSGLIGVDAPLTGVGTGASHLAIPAATASNAGHMTAAQAAALAGKAPVVDWIQEQKADALTRLGLTSVTAATWDDDFQEFRTSATVNAQPWQSVTTAGGNVAGASDGAGGQCEAVRASGTGVIHWRRNTTSFISAGSAKKWYIAVRQKFVTAFGTGNTIAGGGACNIVPNRNDCIEVGISVAASTTKFGLHVVDSVGTLDVASTVNIDTSWHTFRAWCDGSNTYVSVDGETPVAGGRATNFALGCGPSLYMQDNVSAARTVRWDAMVMAVGRDP